MKTFASILARLQIALATLQAVRSVESMDPTTPGNVKADLVIGVVGTAVDAVPAILDAVDKKDTIATITTTSNLAVSIFNAAGIFQHTNKK